MKLVIVGDSLLDIDVQGRVTRLCPDVPAPVLDQSARRVRAGGAGLAAWLAADAGHDVTLVTAIGDDGEAELLRAQLRGVHVVSGPVEAPTPVKTRLLGDGRTLVRVDRCQPGWRAVTVEMLDAVGAADAVLVSDYGHGLAQDRRLRRVLSRLAGRVPVVWDPHPKGAVPVRGVTVATPSLAEARQLSDGRRLDGSADGRRLDGSADGERLDGSADGRRLDGSADGERLDGSADGERLDGSAGGPGEALATAEVVARALRSRWRAAAVAVTLGSGGALLDDGRSPRLLPAPEVAVPDPCGAGDHFAGTVAVRLMHGDRLAEAVERAVVAAAWFLAGGGVSQIGRQDAGTLAGVPTVQPAGRSRPRPAEPLAAAKALIGAVRAGGGIVVATGGCFDLLHAGHARTLNTARSLGDCLIVCLNSDGSVARLKGAGRPINRQSDRAELLRALECVDEVVIFDEDGPERLLGQLRPDVWVKGGDYVADALPEADLLRGWGGAVVVLPYHEGRSSTRLARALSEVG